MVSLKGTKWGSVFCASGARGFYGEGYWFHKLWAPFGLDYSGSHFVTKTTTFDVRPGNMELEGDASPRKWLPDCIVVRPCKGVVLNAVGLSGPGSLSLMRRWAYMMDEDPKLRMFVSFMSVAPTRPERTLETQEFTRYFQDLVNKYGKERFGVQINFSCPNVGLDPKELTSEIHEQLDALMPLHISCLAKFSVTSDVGTITRAVDDHPFCDGIVVSNTIPWGKLPDRIPWKELFGSDESPLKKYGGGGLSGAPLAPLVREWIISARNTGFNKFIIAGGGLLSVDDVRSAFDVGADGVELGSVSILRPWRVQSMIEYANMRSGGSL